MNEIRQNIGVDPREKKDFAVACGERLRVMRQALGGDTIGEFAIKTDVSEDALSSWERGENQVPPWYVQNLKIRFRITHDYIFGGDIAGLPISIAEQAPWPA